MHAVAVLVDVLGDLAIWRQRRGEHDADVVLDHEVRGPVADARLETGVRDGREAPQRAVIGRRLAGVAHPELDIVDALERQEILRLGVRVLVDVRAALVCGAAGKRLGHLINLRFAQRIRRASGMIAAWMRC